MDGAAKDSVRTILRLEALALFLGAIALFWHVSGDWKLFAILILVPDISMLFYVAGPRIGSMAYNAAHSTLGPIVLAASSFAVPQQPLLLPIALIWAAHVGIDRALGYGLKYPTAFGDTHLGRIGRRAAAREIRSRRRCTIISRRPRMRGGSPS
jgi:hypothetical protein